MSYFNDITVGVKEFRDDYVSLITASGTQTIEITGSSIENLTESQVLISPPNTGELPYANYIGVGQLIKSNNSFMVYIMVNIMTAPFFLEEWLVFMHLLV